MNPPFPPPSFVNIQNTFDIWGQPIVKCQIPINIPQINGFENLGTLKQIDKFSLENFFDNQENMEINPLKEKGRLTDQEHKLEKQLMIKKDKYYSDLQKMKDELQKKLTGAKKGKIAAKDAGHYMALLLDEQRHPVPDCQQCIEGTQCIQFQSDEQILKMPPIDMKFSNGIEKMDNLIRNVIKKPVQLEEAPLINQEIKDQLAFKKRKLQQFQTVKHQIKHVKPCEPSDICRAFFEKVRHSNVPESSDDGYSYETMSAVDEDKDADLYPTQETENLVKSIKRCHNISVTTEVTSVPDSMPNLEQDLQLTSKSTIQSCPQHPNDRQHGKHQKMPQLPTLPVPFVPPQLPSIPTTSTDINNEKAKEGASKSQAQAHDKSKCTSLSAVKSQETEPLNSPPPPPPKPVVRIVYGPPSSELRRSSLSQMCGGESVLYSSETMIRYALSYQIVQFEEKSEPVVFQLGQKQFSLIGVVQPQFKPVSVGCGQQFYTTIARQFRSGPDSFIQTLAVSLSFFLKERNVNKSCVFLQNYTCQYKSGCSAEIPHTGELRAIKIEEGEENLERVMGMDRAKVDEVLGRAFAMGW